MNLNFLPAFFFRKGTWAPEELLQSHFRKTSIQASARTQYYFRYCVHAGANFHRLGFQQRLLCARLVQP